MALLGRLRTSSDRTVKSHGAAANLAGSAIGLVCSPDGQFVASGDTGGNVCFWDFKTCKLYNKIHVDPAGGAVNCVAWSEQENEQGVYGRGEGDIKLWD